MLIELIEEVFWFVVKLGCWVVLWLGLLIIGVTVLAWVIQTVSSL